MGRMRVPAQEEFFDWEEVPGSFESISEDEKFFQQVKKDLSKAFEI
jgi:hypothetical protein